MDGSKLPCGICDLPKVSDVWCSECDERLCSDCLNHHGRSKGTRNHNTLPVDQYLQLPIDMIQKSQLCHKHNEKYQMFCQRHDTPCCKKCVIETHNKCEQLVDINDMTNKAELSEMFQDVEETFKVAAENIDKMYQNRKHNLVTISEQQTKIKNEIKEAKKKIIIHLDKIEENLINELNREKEKELKRVNQSITLLDKKSTEIKHFESFIEAVKQHASEHQTFLTMKKLERDLAEHSEFIQSFAKSDGFNNTVISCDINLRGHMKRLGTLRIRKIPSEVTLTRPKIKTSQIMAPVLRQRSIADITLKRQRKIDSSLSFVTGCTVVTGGKMAFSTYNFPGTIKVTKETGSVDFQIKTIGAYDIVYVRQQNILVVSSGTDHKVIIIDLENKKVEMTIDLKYACWGITAIDEDVLFTAGNKGFQRVDLNDYSVTDVFTCDMKQGSYVTTLNETLYYTDCGSDSVTCCDLEGNVKWKFKDKNIINGPKGVAVDNHGHVFVAGFKSNNVVLISPDGQCTRQLLSKEDGLNGPNGLNYDREQDVLLVSNFDGSALCLKLTSE